MRMIVAGIHRTTAFLATAELKQPSKQAKDAPAVFSSLNRTFRQSARDFSTRKERDACATRRTQLRVTACAYSIVCPFDNTEKGYWWIYKLLNHGTPTSDLISTTKLCPSTVAIELGQLTKDSNLRNQSERQKEGEGEGARKKKKKLKRRYRGGRSKGGILKKAHALRRFVVEQPWQSRPSLPNRPNRLSLLRRGHQSRAVSNSKQRPRMASFQLRTGKRLVHLIRFGSICFGHIQRQILTQTGCRTRRRRLRR